MAYAMAWYAATSPDIAGKWREGLLDHILLLENYPERCPVLVPESNRLQKQIRRLLYGKGRSRYHILFEIKIYDVHVFSIRHAFRKQ